MDLDARSVELAREFAAEGIFEKALELLIYRYYFRECLVPDGYEPGRTLGTAIAPSEVGLSVLGKLDKYPDVDENLKRVALFIHWQTPEGRLIDIPATDAEAVGRALDGETRGLKIRFPWKYGRELGDELFRQETSGTLSNDETFKILGAVPQGVYQVGRFIVGPLGVLVSKTKRWIDPPSFVSIPSSRFGGSLRDFVSFTTGDNVVSEMMETITGEMSHDVLGEIWGGLDRLLAQECSAMRVGPDIAAFISNALTRQERRTLLGRLAKAGVFADGLPDTRAMRGALGDLKSLDDAKALQLMLTQPNSVLIAELEEMTDTGDIQLEPDEVRKPLYNPDFFDHVVFEMSPLGARWAPATSSEPLFRLQRIIRYCSTSDEDLDWLLRHIHGSTLNDRLNEYVLRVNPFEVLRTLLNRSGAILDATSVVIGWQGQRPDSVESEQRLLEQMSWKLGFQVPRRDVPITRFRERASRVQSVLRAVGIGEQPREDEIRSLAANLFVSVEELLDLSLNFMTWALLNNHVSDASPMSYSAARAREFTIAKLSREAPRFGKRFEAGSDGQSTLGQSLNGLGVLRDLLGEVESRSADWDRALNSKARSSDDRPETPLLHAVPFMDLRVDDRQTLTSGLAKACRSLAQVDICALRNDFVHRRRASEFPSDDRIDEGIDVIVSVIEELHQQGSVPSVYTLSSQTADSFSRHEWHLETSCGLNAILRTAVGYRVDNLPDADVPQVILRGARFSSAPDCLRFAFAHDSQLNEEWKGHSSGSASRGSEGSDWRAPEPELEGEPILTL